MANRFLDAKITKNVKFMNEDIAIRKLTVSQVMKIQDLAKEVEANPSEQDNIKILALVVQQGAPELADLEPSQLNDFPMDELSRLSGEIMKYSGLGQNQNQKDK